MTKRFIEMKEEEDEKKRQEEFKEELEDFIEKTKVSLQSESFLVILNSDL